MSARQWYTGEQTKMNTSAPRMSRYISETLFSLLSGWYLEPDYLQFYVNLASFGDQTFANSPLSELLIPRPGPLRSSIVPKAIAREELELRPVGTFSVELPHLWQVILSKIVCWCQLVSHLKSVIRIQVRQNKHGYIMPLVQQAFESWGSPPQYCAQKAGIQWHG